MHGSGASKHMHGKTYQKTIYRPEYEHLITILKETREQRGMSQGELGMLLGQDQTYVSKYEKGIRRLDLMETIDICDQLELSTEEILHKIRSLNK